MDKVFQARSARCCRIVTSATEGALAITDLTSSPTITVSLDLSDIVIDEVDLVQLDHSPSANHISSIIGEIATVRASRRSVPVQVLRQNSGGAYVIVGPIDGYDPLGQVYYILPY